MVKNINNNKVLLCMLSLGILCAIPNLEAITLRYLKRNALLNPIASIRRVSSSAVSYFKYPVVQHFSPTTQWDENKHKLSNIEIHNLDQHRFWRLANEQLSKNYPLPYLGNKKIILILGETGVGKSTFINRMLGYKFYWASAGETERESDKEAEDELDFMEHGYDSEKTTGPKKPVIIEDPDIKQQAEIGNSNESCTKVPQVYPLSEDLVLVDCPGFGDTGRIEQNILNMLMIRLLVEKSKKVNAVMCLTSYEKSLGEAGKGEDFLYLARQLDYLFSFEEYIENIFWCFTRYPDGIQKSHIVAQLEAVKKKKLTLKNQLEYPIWYLSQEKKDAILMDKLLQHKNRIMRICPFMNDMQVEQLKNFLTTKTNGCIEKEGFMFHYPELDIKSTVKELFTKKGELITAYLRKPGLAAMMSEKAAKKQALEDILKDESNLAKYIAHETETLRQEIACLEKEINDKKAAIAGKEAVRDNLNLYKEETVELKAGWLNDSKQITYNDLPFDRTEEFYNDEDIQRNSIEHEPNEGACKVKFTVRGIFDTFLIEPIKECRKGLITALSNKDVKNVVGATLGIVVSPTILYNGIVHFYKTNKKYSVRVLFYVKNKYTQSDLVERLENELVLDQSQLEKLKREKESIETKTIDDLKNQCEIILPAEISKYQALIDKNEHILDGQEMPLRFMVEVYPLLYPGVDDELNGFAEKHKDTLQLFAKPQSATGTDGDDAKENNTNEFIHRSPQ